jgi:hypothetical protein
MLLAHLAPEQVVVGEFLPQLADLCGPSEGEGVEVGQDPEAEFFGQSTEWVCPTSRAQGVGEEGQLGWTTDRQEAGEDQCSSMDVGGTEDAPDGVDSLLVCLRQFLDGFLQCSIGSFVGHPLMSWA